MYTTRRLGYPNSSFSEIISVIWQLHVLSVLELSLHLSDVGSVNSVLGNSKDWSFNESQVGLATTNSQTNNRITYLVNLLSSHTKGFSNW